MTEPGGPPTSSEIVFYQGEDGRSRIQVRLDGGTVWLTQRLLAELFQVSVPTINEHLGNLFDEQELARDATIRKFRIVQTEGKREVSRLVDHYNIEVILAVGYRVRSLRGTQFRRWAKLRRQGIVVWLDKDATYTRFVDDLAAKQARGDSGTLFEQNGTDDEVSDE